MSGRGGRGRGRTSTTTNGQVPTVTEEATAQIQPQMDLAALYRNFSSLGGKPFKGTETVVEAQAWIRSCERIFRGLNLDDQQKRFLASWQLQEGALIWWETMIQEEPKENFSWGRFKEVFEERYMPSAGLSRMYQEFLELKQGSMSFEEYVNKFNELSRFGPELVNTPLKKNEKFIRRLQKKYHECMTVHVKESFVDMLDVGYRYASLDQLNPQEE